MKKRIRSLHRIITVVLLSERHNLFTFILISIKSRKYVQLKSLHDCPFYLTHHQTIMGANQSGGATGPTNHGITVVNPTPSTEFEPEERITLPARVPPILSVEGHLIDSNRHGPEVQINKQLWIDFVTTVNKFCNSRADLVALRQSQLQEKIVIVDDQVQQFTNFYINDIHKALAKLNDDCKKIEEINKSLEKCTIQSELCVDMLNKLNFILPSEHKLEDLEPN